MGIDEVGRGAWAGPLLVIAARGRADLPKSIRDSKLLTQKQRLEILDLLTRSTALRVNAEQAKGASNALSNTCEFGEGWVRVSEINKLGLAGSLRLGVARALKSLRVLPGETIILDGKVNYCPAEFINAKCVVGADASIPIVAAASIYAKVLRDRFMQKLSPKHPGYKFENHVGYGTEAHQTALERYGIIDGVHRLAYRPIQKLRTGSG